MRGSRALGRRQSFSARHHEPQAASTRNIDNNRSMKDVKDRLSLAQMFADAQARARSNPTDLSARSTLWQIFAARGELDRARVQLDMMLRLDASWAMEVQGCHSLLDAEARRHDVFSGQLLPSCLGQPPEWFGVLVSALPALMSGHRDAGTRLLKQALADAPACPGSLNGKPFEWVCDGDARLGPCLEFVAQGRYVWAPISSIRRLVCEPPKELRDLVWMPAKLEIDDSGALDVFMPARYPNATNDDHMLARRTDWEALNGNLFIGFGQKMFSTNLDLIGLLDLRELSVSY